MKTNFSSFYHYYCYAALCSQILHKFLHKLLFAFHRRAFLRYCIVSIPYQCHHQFSDEMLHLNIIY